MNGVRDLIAMGQGEVLLNVYRDKGQLRVSMKTNGGVLDVECPQERADDGEEADWLQDQLFSMVSRVNSSVLVRTV